MESLNAPLIGVSSCLIEGVFGCMATAVSNGIKRGRDAQVPSVAATEVKQRANLFPELPNPQLGTSMTMAEVISASSSSTSSSYDPKNVLSTRSSLKWIRRMRRLFKDAPSSLTDCYYLSELSPHRKDLDESSFSVKDVEWYRGFVARAMACSKVAAKHLLNRRSDQLKTLSRSSTTAASAQTFAEPDEDDCKRMRTFLLEADLTDQRTRMLDWKAQELYRMILAYVSLQMRSRRAAELAAAAPGKHSLSEAQDVHLYALDIAERGMMQTLAWIHELRAYYVFADEKLAIGACALNGSRPILLKNSTYIKNEELLNLRSAGRPPGNPVGDFGDRHGPFLVADGVLAHPQQQLYGQAGVVPQSSHLSRDTKSASNQLLKYLNQGINACVRWDSVEGKYVVFYESHTIAEERDTQLRRSMGFGSRYASAVNYVHMSAIADTEAHRQGFSMVAPTLIKGVPTTFYVVAERKAFTACVDRIISLIDIVARTTEGFENLESSFPKLKSSNFVYFGKAHGSLSASDFCLYRMPLPASKGTSEFVLAVLPCLVLDSLQSVRLLAFGLYINLLTTMPQHAEWMYPGGASASKVLEDTAFGKVYSDGYNFGDWEDSMHSMAFEFHPGYTFFRIEAKRVIDTHRLTTSRRIYHDFDGTADCTRKLCLRGLYRFSDENPGAPLPEFTLLVPLEDFDHSAVIPKTGPIKEEPVYGSGPAGCTFTACKTLASECRKGACLICSKDLDVARISVQGRDKRSFVMLSYKDIPMWQYSLSLRNVRNLLLKLDAEASARGTCFATVEDLDVWIKREANLGPLWVKLKEEFLVHIKDMEGFHSQMVANYTKMHVHSTSNYSRAMGEPVDNRLIKRVMADHAEEFCTDEFGPPKARQANTIRFGDSHGLVVFVGDENAGSYQNWKPPCDKGNIFELVVNHVFNTGSSGGVREQVNRAAEYCYNWLIKRFGTKYVEQWEAKSNATSNNNGASATDKSATAAANAAKRIQNMTRDSIEEARRIWLVSKKITKESYEVGYCTSAVEYLRGRRITSDALIFGNKALRYNPVCSVAEGEDAHYQSPALVIAVMDPADRNKESPDVMGIHAVYLDPSTNRKAEDLLDVQKRSRGAVRGHACRIQAGSLDPEVMDATLGEYKALIAIGEGPETMMSVAQACPGLEVYCVLSIGNIANFPYIGHKKWGAGIIYCADNDISDDPKKQAIKEKTRMDNVNKLREKNYTVLLCMPQLIDGKSTDFNDVLTNASDAEVGLIKIKRAVVMAQTFTPTSIDPDATKVVELTDDGKHLKEMPKKAAEEKDPKKRKAMLIEAMRKRNEGPTTEAGPKEEKKKKVEESSVSEFSDSEPEEPIQKKKKKKPAPKRRETPPPKDSSSSESSSTSSESASSSSSSESESDGEKSKKKQKKKKEKEKKESSDDSDKEEEEQVKKPRLKKFVTTEALTTAADSAQGSASSPSTPLVQLGEGEDVIPSTASSQKETVAVRRPKVIEEDP